MINLSNIHILCTFVELMKGKHPQHLIIKNVKYYKTKKCT